jgi:hypothetical protein
MNLLSKNGRNILTWEARKKFILGWWHRLSSLYQCVLKVGAALMTLSFQDALYKEYQEDIPRISSFISTGWKACATRFPGID